MTEVPEYLLERSRQRRAALGLPGGSAPAAGAGAGDAPAASAAPSGGGAVATAEAPATPQPAAAATATAVVAEPEPVPTVDRGPRSGIPWWMMPVLLVLPFWAIIYMGAFAAPKAAGGARTGPQIFATAGCTSCHGPTGGGGVGPKLAGGETKLTFPNVDDMIKWVTEGSSPARGQKYGDPNRPGGQHGPASGGMPAFGGQLSPEEIVTVVNYVRDQL